MRKMMQMSLKLMTDISLIRINEIRIDSENDLLFATVVTSGSSGVYKFECIGPDDEHIVTSNYTYRNTFEFSSYKNIKKIIVYVKKDISSQEYTSSQIFID